MMSFWFGATLHDFLFKGFNITTLPGFLAVCVMTSILSFLLVLLTYFKEQFKGVNFHKKPQLRALSQGNGQVIGQTHKSHAICTFLTLCQSTLGYLLMLVSMTFNAYLLIAIVIGSSIAYFSLNQKFMSNQFTSVPSSRTSGNTLQVNLEERGSLIGNEGEVTMSVARAEVHGY